MMLDIVVDGAPRQARVGWAADGAHVTIDGVGAAATPRPDRVVAVGDEVVVISNGRQRHVSLRRHDVLDAVLDGDGTVAAPMNGKVIAVFVEPGQQVKKGARVALMEAMKMEHSLTAPIDGTVTEVAAVAGGQAVEGAALVRIEADAPHHDR